MTEILIGDDFVDPVLYDVDEEDLVDRALADMQSVLPELAGREGTIEVVLLRALALQVAEVVYAINRLPERTLEGILQLRGLVRDDGAPAAVTVRFTLSDALGVTVPAGTTVRVEVTETGEVVDFATTVDVTSDPEAVTVDAPAVAVEPGTSANGVAAGTAVEVIDAVPYVEAAVTVTVVAGGRDAEDDTSFYGRGVAMLSRLTETLVLPSHFRAAALETPGVGYALVLDQYDPTDPGVSPGHVTVLVTDVDGEPLASGPMLALEAHLGDLSVAGLAVHVAAPAYDDVDLAVQVTAAGGAAPATVTAAVEDALTSYLAPLNWSGGTTIWHNELVSLIDQVPGVGRVVSITPGTDVALSDVTTLPRPGTITVTVP